MNCRRPRDPLWPILLCLALTASLTAACGNDKQKAAEHLKRGDDFVKRDDLPNAIIEYRNVLSLEPTNADVALKLARVYMKAGQAEPAGRMFVRAANLRPDDIPLQLEVARLMISTEAFEPARLRADEILKRDPKNVEAMIIAGRATAGMRDLGRALEEAEEAVHDQPDVAVLQTHLGALQIARGKFRDAEATLKKALELDPGSVAAHVELANLYWAAGRPAVAYEHVKPAVTARPNDALLNKAFATLELALGRPEQAEASLKRWAETTDSDTARLALADFYLLVRRPADARPLFESIKERAVRPTAEARLAVLDDRAGKKKEARARVAEALRTTPNDEDLQLVSVRFYLADGQLEAARRRLAAAARAHPRSAIVQWWLGEVLSASNEPAEAVTAYRKAVNLSPSMLPAHMRVADLLIESGDPAAAIASAREAVMLRPGLPAAQLLLAKAYTAHKDFTAARDILDKLLKARPGWPPALIQYGLLESEAGRPDVARGIFAKLTAKPDAPPLAIGGLVQSLLVTKRTAEARAALRPHLARRPDDPRLLMLSASVSEAQGDYDDAERTLRRVIEVAPQMLPAYAVLGRMLASRGRLGEARTEFEMMAKRQTRPVAAHTLLGMTYEMEGRTAEAEHHYEMALKNDPRAPIAANNLAWLLSQRDDSLGRALELAQIARQQMPKQAEFNDTLGWIHYRQGVTRLAITRLEEAVALDSSNPSYHYHLGLAYMKAGDRGRARVSLKQALSSGREFEGSDAAQRLLVDLDTAPAAGQESTR